MSKIVTGALLAALFLSTSASAQNTCRAADVTSDGFVGLPDFTALAVCFGQPVDVPLPQGQYVGFAPSTRSDNSVSVLTRDQECRDNFGPTAHWCTTLEMTKIPDVTALPDGEDQQLAVRLTPPVQVAGGSPGTDWVTGELFVANATSVFFHRSGSSVEIFPNPSGPFLGPACCMEQPAP